MNSRRLRYGERFQASPTSWETFSHRATGSCSQVRRAALCRSIRTGARLDTSAGCGTGSGRHRERARTQRDRSVKYQLTNMFPGHVRPVIFTRSSSPGSSLLGHLKETAVQDLAYSKRGTMVALSGRDSCVTLGEISRLRKYFFRAL